MNCVLHVLNKFLLRTKKNKFMVQLVLHFCKVCNMKKKRRNIDDRYEWYKDFIYKLFPIKVLSINLLNKMYTFYCKKPRN